MVLDANRSFYTRAPRKSRNDHPFPVRLSSGSGLAQGSFARIRSSGPPVEVGLGARFGPAPSHASAHRVLWSKLVSGPVLALPLRTHLLTGSFGRSWSSGPRLGPDWAPAARTPADQSSDLRPRL